MSAWQTTSVVSESIPCKIIQMKQNIKYYEMIHHTSNIIILIRLYIPSDGLACIHLFFDILYNSHLKSA
jgi:hypothetical protein